MINQQSNFSLETRYMEQKQTHRKCSSQVHFLLFTDSIRRINFTVSQAQEARTIQCFYQHDDNKNNNNNISREENKSCSIENPLDCRFCFGPIRQLLCSTTINRGTDRSTLCALSIAISVNEPCRMPRWRPNANNLFLVALVVV